ncbi:effector-associated domain EAD1-containing protein [Dactylosporangium sp. NPDC049742]|uniref:effector-associated domain EAD1-containing protein n=1 Tax=Dactylosporangium sp. NPDC049742 TaxID=3154737 RepID=UPI00341ADFAF
MTGRRLGSLLEAILAAYPSRADLDRLLLFSLDRRLSDYAGETGLRQVVFELIRAAQAEGWLAQLVDAVYVDRGGNQLVRAWVAANGSLSVAATGQDFATDEGGLERTIRGHVPDLDPAQLRQRIEEAEGRVCRVEADTTAGPRPLGTGVLVGPGLCLTAYHVISGVQGDAIRLRFDYRSAAGTGHVFALERDWLAASARPSAADGTADAAVPDPAELDFAVLRVAGDPGKQPAPSGAPRGWIESVRVDAPEPYDDLFLLHHPDGRPLRLSIGPLLDVNANGTRLRHAVNTAPGSSGAPCFDVNLALVAMHQGGDPDFRPQHRPTHNRAIPISAIRRALPPSLAAF